MPQIGNVQRVRQDWTNQVWQAGVRKLGSAKLDTLMRYKSEKAGLRWTMELAKTFKPWIVLGADAPSGVHGLLT